MKNCGDELHAEVFSKSFMDAMKTVVKVGPYYTVIVLVHTYYYTLGQ